jgi:hypothetical protein
MELLQTHSDEEAARLTGCPITAVRQKRSKLTRS